MFKNPFSFNGRIRRLEYGLTYVFFIAIVLLMTVFDDANSTWGSAADFGLVIIVIPMYWIMIAQGAKRCHDLDNSGWFQLIPFYGFWMLFANSNYGPNRFGPNPKGEGNFDDIDDIGNYLQAEPVQYQ